MTGNVFEIKTPSFEGPLELLLQLIEKRKLFISDVSLAQVTDDYIEHIKSIGYFPMRDTAQFILVASTLLLLKSRALLPSIALTLEEEESIEDLERRLKLYKFFSECARGIANIYGKHIIFQRTYTKVTEPIFSPQDGFNASAALDSANAVIAALPRKTKKPEVSVKKIATLEETIQSLTKRIEKSLKMTFREFTNESKAERVEVIVGFLAVLQLVKEEVIEVSQSEHFDDIHIESRRPGLPRY